MSNEHILVIPANALVNHCRQYSTEGQALESLRFIPFDEAFAEGMYNDLTPFLQFKWRPHAEQQVPGSAEHDRQVIPYTLLSAMIDNTQRYAVYRRVKGTAESRLLGRYSIGFGGHITVDDIINDNGVIALYATVNYGMMRELIEEVGLDAEEIQNFTTRGYVHASESPVDSLHFAMVNEVMLDDHTRVTSNETSIELIGWFTAEELKANAGGFEFENWSQYVIDAL